MSCMFRWYRVWRFSLTFRQEKSQLKAICSLWLFLMRSVLLGLYYFRWLRRCFTGRKYIVFRCMAGFLPGSVNGSVKISTIPAEACPVRIQRQVRLCCSICSGIIVSSFIYCCQLYSLFIFQLPMPVTIILAMPYLVYLSGVLYIISSKVKYQTPDMKQNGESRERFKSQWHITKTKDNVYGFDACFQTEAF